jgi:hypothetical protein
MLTEKVRTVLRLRFSKQLHKDIKEEIGEDEFNFFMEIANEKNEINAKLLSELLKVYADMQHAFIKYLPLELAVFRLLGGE